MESKNISIDNKVYVSICDVYLETKHYILADELDDNLVSLNNYVFIIEENDTYELIEDEEIKSILAKLFLPLMDNK